jgi:glycosyltransferase involved in cell wall biosynthesis
MASEPLVSVCIPSYNNEEFIAHTLKSVLDQTFRDFEVVVVDDCSTDQTVSIVKSFSDLRIRLHQNPRNLGLGENWNKALSRARGKYVKLLCGDDVLQPTCLEHQTVVLEDPGNRNVVLAICNRTVINPAGDVIFRRRFPKRCGRVAGPALIRKSVRWGSNLIGEPAVGLFRNEALKQTNLCDPANPYAIDLGLWAEVLKHGDAFVDATPLASFRISSKAASARIGLRQAAYFRAFVSKLRKDSHYRISLTDALSGSVLSLLWCVLRNGFIHAHASRLAPQRGQPYPRFAPKSCRLGI